MVTQLLRRDTLPSCHHQGCRKRFRQARTTYRTSVPRLTSRLQTDASTRHCTDLSYARSLYVPLSVLWFCARVFSSNTLVFQCKANFLGGENKRNLYQTVLYVVRYLKKEGRERSDKPKGTSMQTGQLAHIAKTKVTIHLVKSRTKQVGKSTVVP